MGVRGCPPEKALRAPANWPTANEQGKPPRLGYQDSNLD